MATKNSRYRDRPVRTPAMHAGASPAHDADSLPAVTGTFRHVLADGDRVDQLADRYYGDPMAWWQICDANSDFLSPWDFSGKNR